MTLINTLEAPGEFDALTTLRPGEPYFLLVGRDRLAPELVQHWADANRKKALAQEATLTDDERAYELRKSTEAELIAWGMREYKAAPAKPAKAKRSKPAKTTAYTGHVLDAATEAREKESRTRKKAASVINNAIAELFETKEDLRPYDPDTTLAEVIGELRDIAARVVPSRPV